MICDHNNIASCCMECLHEAQEQFAGARGEALPADPAPEQRARFEAWAARTLGIGNFDRTQDEEADYLNPDTNDLWRCWQEARADDVKADDCCRGTRTCSQQCEWGRTHGVKGLEQGQPDNDEFPRLGVGSTEKAGANAGAMPNASVSPAAGNPLEDLALLIQLCDRLADEGEGSMYHADTLAQRNAVVRRLREHLTPGVMVVQPQRLAAVVEEVAQGWDGCMYDAPGSEIDIGAALRKQLTELLSLSACGVTPAHATAGCLSFDLCEHDSPLFCKKNGCRNAGVTEAPVYPTTYGPNCIPQTPTASPVGVTAAARMNDAGPVPVCPAGCLTPCNGANSGCTVGVEGRKP